SSPASPASRPYQATTYVGTFGLVIVTPSSRSGSRPPIIAFRYRGQRTKDNGQLCVTALEHGVPIE
ncbi:MAG: hypothetical protein ACLQVF_06650, partial [Isosphaeraceae bacterium]